MCRNIKMLFNFDPPVTEEEIRAASLQFVRKVSGFNKPSKANEAAFLAAVEELSLIHILQLQRLGRSVSFLSLPVRFRNSTAQTYMLGKNTAGEM